MEKEINELKSIYLSTKAPQELEDEGFKDVLKKIDAQREPFYISKVFISAIVLFLFLLIGSAAVALTPSNAVDSLKHAAHFVTDLVKNKPEEPGKVNFITPVIKKPTATPTNLPTPTEKATNSSNNRINKGNVEYHKSENNQEKEVEGVSTQNTDKIENDNSSHSDDASNKKEDNPSENANRNSGSSNSSHANEHSENHGNSH